MNFEIHHFAYLTDNMDFSIKEFNSLGFDLEGPIFDISSQKVNVCFLKNSNNIRYELVMPYKDNSTLNKLILSGVKLYHVGYIVSSIELVSSYLISEGYYQINTFNSEAFSGNKCAFYISSSKNLIELIER
jgi:hypothetical protein